MQERPPSTPLAAATYQTACLRARQSRSAPSPAQIAPRMRPRSRAAPVSENLRAVPTPAEPATKATARGEPFARPKLPAWARASPAAGLARLPEEDHPVASWNAPSCASLLETGKRRTQVRHATAGAGPRCRGADAKHSGNLLETETPLMVQQQRLRLVGR